MGLPAILLALAGLIVFLIFGYWHPSFQSIVELPVLLSLQDPALYSRDYYVQSMTKPQPRYFYYRALVWMSSWGLSLSWSYFVVYVCSFVLLISGLFSLAARFTDRLLGGAILTSLVLFTTFGTLGASFVFKPEPLPSVYAMAIALWGVVGVLSRRWILGYLCFALAGVMQFLVGVLPALLFLPLLLIGPSRAVITKCLLLSLVLFGSLALFFSGSGCEPALDEGRFTQIYAFVRHPHHVIPSHFPYRSWMEVLVMGAAAIGVLSFDRTFSKADRLQFTLLLGGSAVALLINYLFVEIIPISSIAKLQLARVTPFTKIICCLVVTIWAVARIKQRQFVVAAAVLLGCLSLPSSLGPHLPTPFWLKWFGFAVLLLPALAASSLRAALPSAGGLAVSAAVFALILNLHSRVRPNFESYYEGFEATSVARRLSEIVPVDAVLMVPPMRFEFRYFSKRSLSFDFMAFPYTPGGMVTWAERFEQMGGGGFRTNQPAPWNEVDALYSKRTAKELLAMARSTKANFIVTQEVWHPNLTPEVLLRMGSWVVYRVGLR